MIIESLPPGRTGKFIGEIDLVLFLLIFPVKLGMQLFEFPLIGFFDLIASVTIGQGKLFGAYSAAARFPASWRDTS